LLEARLSVFIELSTYNPIANTIRVAMEKKEATTGSILDAPSSRLIRRIGIPAFSSIENTLFQE